jgi:YVTN family beta-propeller protein
MEALLGKGGMGAVYRARHILLGDRVAIKVLPPEVRTNAEWLRRFRREGQAARRFRHPNAVTVYDLRTAADGTIYIGAQYGDAISVIDPATRTIRRNIPMPAGVRPLEPSADGKTLYAALSKLLGFVVVDLGSGKVTRTVELGTLPEGVPPPYKDTWTHALQLANGGTELWLCDDINDLIRVVRLSDMKEVAQIRTGHFPHWFAMRPDGKVLFVSLWFSDAVAAIDVQTKKVVSNMQFERGSGPKRIAIGNRVR